MYLRGTGITRQGREEEMKSLEGRLPQCQVIDPALTRSVLPKASRWVKVEAWLGVSKSD